MTNEQSDADFLRELAHYTSTLSHENEARVRRIADLLDTFALEPEAEPEWQWTRDDDTTRDCLLLVCMDIPVSEIATWTDEQVQHVEQWAGACHAVASDSELEIPPKPTCIIEWQSALNREGSQK